MRTITLYHDPKHQVLHTVVAEVDDLSGNHTVVNSLITTESSLFAKNTYQRMIGKANVRAYTITEVG